MPAFDCQLEHHPLVRITADTPEAASAEYFRLYGITASNAPWTCAEVKDGSPAPVEPLAWVNRRKELGTGSAESLLSPAESVPPSPVDKAPDAVKATAKAK